MSSASLQNYDSSSDFSDDDDTRRIDYRVRASSHRLKKLLMRCCSVHESLLKKFLSQKCEWFKGTLLPKDPAIRMLAGKRWRSITKKQIDDVVKLREHLRVGSFEQDHKILKEMLDNLEASKKIAEFIYKIEDIEISVQMNRMLEETQNAEKALNKVLNKMELLRSLLCLKGNLKKLLKKPVKNNKK